jgi:hypothetical protein
LTGKRDTKVKYSKSTNIPRPRGKTGTFYRQLDGLEKFMCFWLQIFCDLQGNNNFLKIYYIKRKYLKTEKSISHQRSLRQNW